jgi:hypothetical protein
MSVATGLKVMAAMMEAEVAELAGPRGKHDLDRVVGRHGSARSSVTLGARRVSVIRPRVRSTDGQEVALSAFAAFTNDDLLAEAVMSQMLAGLAARAIHCRVRAGRARGQPAVPGDLALGGLTTVRQDHRDRAGRAAGP